MGFLGAGQGFNQGVQNLFQNYNQGAELSMAREEQARQAKIQALLMQHAQQEQLAKQQALQQEAAYKQEMGLLGDNPTVEQLFAIQRKYDPKNAINNQLIYTKSEEANKLKMDMFEQNMKHQIEMLNMKNDAASQLQAQKLQNVLDAIKLKFSMPNVNIINKGLSVGDQIKLEEREEKKREIIYTIDDTVAYVDKLLAHPGLKTVTGKSSVLDPRNIIPGTDAYDFRKELESFDSKLFLSNIKSMKGMGTLSDAEGKKVSDAAGAIKPGMSEKSFIANMGIIKDTLAKAKERTSSGKFITSSGNPLAGKPAGRYRVNGKEVKWDGTKEL